MPGSYGLKTTTPEPVLKNIVGACYPGESYKWDSFQSFVGQKDTPYECFFDAGCGWKDPHTVVPTGYLQGQYLRIAGTEGFETFANAQYYGDFVYKTACDGSTKYFGASMFEGIPLGTAEYYQGTVPDALGDVYYLGQGEPPISDTQVYLIADFRVEPKAACPLDDVASIHPDSYPGFMNWDLDLISPLNGIVSVGTLLKPTQDCDICSNPILFRDLAFDEKTGTWGTISYRILGYDYEADGKNDCSAFFNYCRRQKFHAPHTVNGSFSWQYNEKKNWYAGKLSGYQQSIHNIESGARIIDAAKQQYDFGGIINGILGMAKAPIAEHAGY